MRKYTFQVRRIHITKLHKASNSEGNTKGEHNEHTEGGEEEQKLNEGER